MMLFIHVLIIVFQSPPPPISESTLIRFFRIIVHYVSIGLRLRAANLSVAQIYMLASFHGIDV